MHGSYVYVGVRMALFAFVVCVFDKALVANDKVFIKYVLASFDP